jgi:tetratricopeptide (TPR) repeat protein
MPTSTVHAVLTRCRPVTAGGARSRTRSRARSELLDDNVGVQEDEALLRAAAVIGVSFSADLLAAMAGMDPGDVLDALAERAPAGLLHFDARGGRFRDETEHEALCARTPPSERVRLHARAAEVLVDWYESGRPGVPPAEVARHLVAAGASDRASGFFVAAGDAAMETRRYGAASDHYQSALNAQPPAGHADQVTAAAAIGLGSARLAHGELEPAREAFQSAVEPARRTGRGDLLAEAALGLGSGPTGFEVPLVDRAQLDLLEEALAALSDNELELRARVLARLAVATTLVEDEVRRRFYAAQAVELARAAGDPAALTAALAARCDVMAGPEHTELRRQLADEIVTAARAIKDREMELLGRRHRLVALAESGDIEGVDAEIRDFASLSDVIGQSLYAWYVPLWRGMRALMVGRIHDCRRWLDEVAVVGERAGSHNAYLLAATLRWGLLSETDDRPGLTSFAEHLGIEEVPAVWAQVALALMAAETGRTAAAVTRLDSVAPRLATATRDSEWIPMLCQVAELIGHIGGHPVASWAYEALRPYADQLAVEGIGAAIRGSVHRHLGLLAAALGNAERGVDHFTAAIDVHRAIGAPLLVARTYRDWGVALGDRGALERALTWYEQLGIDARTAELRRLLGTAATPWADEQRFAREGQTWSLTFAGSTVRMRDAKGLRDIALLLRTPGRAVPAMELAAPRGRPGRPTGETLHEPGDLGEVLDQTARAAYRRRLSDLDEEISEAENFGDGDRAAKARAERDLLVKQLASAYGLGGRPRRMGDPAERARTAVTARIRDTIRRIEGLHPELGRHLRLSVRTGTLCVYEPDLPATWTLS